MLDDEPLEQEAPLASAAVTIRRLSDSTVVSRALTNARGTFVGEGLGGCSTEHAVTLTVRADVSRDAGVTRIEPDIVQAAISRAGLPPDRLLMVGDTPYDVEAARRARVAIVAVRCGGWDDAGLEGAVAVVEDPAELLERYEEIFLSR